MTLEESGNPDYRRYLNQFLLFTFGSTDANQERLLEITPNLIVRFLKFKAYGNPDANVEVDLPTKFRSNSIEYAKKSISSFMPLIEIQWDPILNRGNPTKSAKVNKLIRKVKLREVRGQGAPSQECRSLRLSEIKDIIRMLKESRANQTKRYKAIALLCIQFHLIGRLDDCLNIVFSNISACPFKSCFQIRIKWSKNCREERDSALQSVTPCCLIFENLLDG